MQSGGGTVLGNSQNTTGQDLEQTAVALKSDLLEPKEFFHDQTSSMIYFSWFTLSDSYQ